MKKYFALISLVVLILACPFYRTASGKESASVQDGKEVSFDYTLTVDGEVIDSSEERGPLKYVHGQGQIIWGLSRQMEGLHIGDEKTIEVTPEEGYGEFDSTAVAEVALTSLPPDINPKVGMVLRMNANDGKSLPVRISAIKDDIAVLDFNHPLAGKTLTFQVKIIDIR